MFLSHPQNKNHPTNANQCGKVLFYIFQTVSEVQSYNILACIHIYYHYWLQLLLRVNKMTVSNGTTCENCYVLTEVYNNGVTQYIAR